MSSKRGQGEGSIYKRSDGRWAAVVNLGWRNGKRHRKSFYGRTRAEVQAKLTEALRSQQLGLPVAPERQTVEQFLNRWLEDSARPSIRPSTYRSYEQLVRIHLVPGLGKHQLSKLSPQHVQQFLNDKSATDLSARSVQYLHAVLRRALGQALRWDLVARNVATLVDPPRVTRKEVEPLSPDQAAKFLRALNRNRLEALFSVAIACGLRQGEALGLKWEDVDWEEGTLRVRRALQRINGKLDLCETKTAQSRRTLALPGSIVRALRLHRARQQQERLLAGSGWVENGLVFTTRHGKPLDARNVTRSFKRALEKAKLPAKRFHDCRHTAASLLLAQGVHPRTVMETLGHSQIGLTLNTYSHVMPSLLRDAADKMDEVLSKQG